MAKVLISVNTAWNIANFRLGLVSALRAAGHEVVAVAPVDDSVDRIGQAGCRFVALPMDNKGTSPVRDAILTCRYFFLLRRERPDIFLGYTIKPNIYGSLAAHALGIPAINNISGLGTAFIKTGLLTRIVKALYRIALRKSAVVFFQNTDDRDLFAAGGLVRGDRARLLPGSGVDLARFQPAPVENRDPGGLRFLLIARLLRDKGVMEFVEAARKVKAQAPDSRFQLLGFVDAQNRTAISRQEIDRWVGEGTVEYLGATDDVRPFISQADCVVLPSYREGTPRTLLEAAAMARPLIATDVPGCREVVEDGRNGFLCRVRDADDLAAKVSAFVALPQTRRNEMGRESRSKVEREFDEKIVVARYLEAIESSLKGRQIVSTS